MGVWSLVLTTSPLPPSAFSWCWRSRCGKVGVFLRRSVTEVIEQMCNDRGTCANNCYISHKFSKQQLTPYYKCAYTIYKHFLLDNYKSLIACRTHNDLWQHQNFESCLTKIKWIRNCNGFKFYHGFLSYFSPVIFGSKIEFILCFPRCRYCDNSMLDQLQLKPRIVAIFLSNVFTFGDSSNLGKHPWITILM